MFDTELSQTIQELEAKMSGVEGAIFNTVNKITNEAARRTQGVIVLGEQAVRGIEERYVENLESIRQSLTDEVINRIESEATKIAEYKERIDEMSQNHLRKYGSAVSTINETIQLDLDIAKRKVQTSIDVLGTIACRFLEEFDEEVLSMGDRIEKQVKNTRNQILVDFRRSLEKVKQEVSMFARKQFELANKSNLEVADVFRNSIENFEEKLMEELERYNQKMSEGMEETIEFIDIVHEHLQEITKPYLELQ
ncbi:MAG: hypothetical protein U9O98_10870 [Asgard group archaeon]|nr:hypothetical protein [Asgard group archaeon]